MVLEKPMVPAEGRTRKLIKWMFQAAAVIPGREWTPEYPTYFMHKLVKKITSASHIPNIS
jgi:hypothetical protein